MDSVEKTRTSGKLKVIIAETNREGLKMSGDFFKAYNYEIVGMTASGLEVVSLTMEKDPDIIICDPYLLDIDAVGILDTLQRENLISKIAFIVASSVNNAGLIESVLNSGADYFALRPFDFAYMDKKIRELRSMKLKPKAPEKVISTIKIEDTFDLQNYISRLMHEVGVPAHIRGYHYIRDSIIMSLERRDILKSITKELYPSIGKHNNTTASRVERAIRHAVEVAWSRGDVDVLNSIFGYTVKSTKGKPTNGEFISMLTERVRLDLKIA